MKKKKSTILDYIITALLLAVLIVVSIYNKEIVTYLMVNVVYKNEVVILDPNDYQKPFDYGFVQNTKSFEPQNEQDLLNIIYTILNNGWNNFTFYCPTSYKNCMNEFETLIQNEAVLSNINNFVHPFNSFDKIYFTTNNFGKIELEIEKTYSEDMIQEINEKIEQVLEENIKEDMNDEEKIKILHDVIIDFVSYDQELADIIENNLDQSPTYLSNTAYGTLLSGKAICGGYADTMAIFLNKLGINNYKISSENHIWNYVNLGNSWYHLDLTWDDPLISTGENILLHNFFLINTEELHEKDTSQHTYDTNVFQEAK